MFRTTGFILILLLLSGTVPAAGQKAFVEGCLTYVVSLDAGESSTGITQHAGTYRIYLKDRMIRKELKLDNGYQNTLIWDGNTGTAYSLQETPDQRYAVQLSQQDLEASQKQYRKFKLNDTKETDLIAGLSCKKAVASYPGGSETQVCYTKDWKISESMMFEWFPGIGFLPLSFEFRNSGGVLLRFHAEMILDVPVETALFRLPPGYRVISNNEYRKLLR